MIYNNYFIKMEFIKEPPHITLSSYSWSGLSHVELHEHGNKLRKMAPDERDIYLATNQENIKGCFGISPQDYEKWNISLTYVGEVRIAAEHKRFGDKRHEDGSYYDSGLMPLPAGLTREDQQPYWPLSVMYSQEKIAEWVESGYIHELLKTFD